MNAERWQEIAEVFGAALEVAPEERAAFLHRSCSGDEDLLNEAASLLEFDAAPRGIFDAPVSQVIARLLSGASAAPPAPAAVGESIGPYKVLRELGRGGAGTVYLALRDDDQYRQRVALKVIHADKVTAEVRGRFRRERQILASLDHANIARLLDAGSTEAGLPYVVVELVEGQPIDRYCESHGLGLAQRLELFRTVCSAVHEAHRNLIVHRDLKPANILVSAEGVPKLLDFGIAKLLNPELAPEALHSTSPSLLPMTPAYASPEQVRGDPITTASDVYSLGVLLYQLVAGELPYRFDRVSPREVERQICETEPPAPSARPGLARAWRHRLRGDLDHIVLKALRKEPRRRYGSAEELSEDLRRHLAHLPVKARKDTWGYRTWKLVRRNRLAAALVFLLIAFGFGVTVQSFRLGRALELAGVERERAERVSGFLVHLFEVADPNRSRGETLTAREVLDLGAQKVEGELAEEPLLQAALLETLGLVYQNLGLLEDSAPLLESSLEIRRRVLGRAHPDVARGLSRVAFQRYLEEDFDTAEALYLESLETRRGLFGDHHPAIAESLNELAEIHHVRGETEMAERKYRQALEMRRRLHGGGHPAVAESLYELGSLLREHGDTGAALPLLREALEIERRTKGEEHTQVATIESDLGYILRKSDPAEAESLFRRALSTYRKLLGPEHQWTTTTMRNLARLRRSQGDFEEAEALMREALRVRRATLPAGDPGIAFAVQDLGMLALDREDFETAAELLAESFRILRDAFTPNDWRTAVVQSVLGECLTRLGRWDEAEALLVASHRSLVASLGEEHSRTRVAADRLAELYEASGSSSP